MERGSKVQEATQAQNPALGCEKRESELRSTKGELVDFFALIPQDVRERMGSADTTPEAREAHRNEKRLEDKQAEYWQASGLANVQDDCTLDGFQILDDTQERATFLVNYFAGHYPKISKGLMLWGQSGVGKSRLIKALGYMLIYRQQPVKVAYCSCADLHKKSHAECTTYLNEHLLRSKIVILDDFEKAYGKPSAQKVIKLLIDHVDTYGKITLLATSNIPLDQTYGYVIDDRHDQCHKAIWPDFIYGRMARLFKWHRVNGPNYRTEYQANQDWDIED